jgi:hypothetical protein
MRRHLILLLGWAASATVALAACGSTPACPVTVGADEVAPSITELSLVGTLNDPAYASVQHLGGDPWTLIVALGFHDEQGDVGGGTLRFFMDGSEVFRSDMEALLAERGLAQTAQDGRVSVPLRLEMNSDYLSSGGTSTLSLQAALVDGAGNASSCRTIDLTVTYTP